MSALYDRLAVTSLALLTKFGQSVTRRRTTRAAYSPATGAAGSPVAADVVFKGAIFDFGEGITQVDGEEVRKDDKKLLVEPGASPVVTDEFIVGGVAYTVLSVMSISPAGTAVLHSLHLRR